MFLDHKNTEEKRTSSLEVIDWISLCFIFLNVLKGELLVEVHVDLDVQPGVVHVNLDVVVLRIADLYQREKGWSI